MALVETANGLFEIDMNDCYIRNHMMSGQVFEHHIIDGPLKRYITDKENLVDVGANIGCHAITYAKYSPDATIWAFEPQRETWDILNRNIHRNNLESRIHAINFALGHKEFNSQLASLDTVFDKNMQSWNKGGIGIGKGGEKMRVITLDSLKLPGLDFMKIDVEGAEGLVVMGAKETIRKYKPVICFEHNYMRIDPKDVGLEVVPSPFEELVKLGYKTFKYLDWENYLAFPK